MNIEGIAAVVTGGASGLGRATAERLVAADAKVVIADLPTSNGEATAREFGGGTRFVAADVTDTDQPRSLARFALWSIARAVAARSGWSTGMANLARWTFMRR
jgi:NAD(P)-dependent dehydrogenase (short-subunit alcohol dehydrogenase family)